MNSDTVISVRNITKIYSLYDNQSDRLKEAWSPTHKIYHTDHYALHDINFDVKKGECLGIIGTNGSGKSTLLKIITGVLQPTEGTVEKKGRISALLELGAGFNQEYTGLKNIYLNGIMMGYTNEEIDAKVQSVVDFAEIGEFINQPVKTYSSGMFARLAFAVAINVDPDILIVDEALSVGDIFFQAKCYKKFNEFQEQGKTILFVSHDLGSVLKYCNRALLLNTGTQVVIGPTAPVVDTYRKILVSNVHVADKDIGEDARKIEAAKKKEQEEYKEENKIDSTLWKSNLVLNPNVQSYGNGKAEITDFAIMDSHGNIQNSVMKAEDFTVKMKIHFNSELVDPIFAYTIKDLKGQELTGTNTYLEDNMTHHADRGQEITVEFNQKMVLQSGQYLLCLGCAGYEDGKYVVYHRLYDVCNLHVISEKNTIGFVDMFASVKYD